MRQDTIIINTEGCVYTYRNIPHIRYTFISQDGNVIVQIPEGTESCDFSDSSFLQTCIPREIRDHEKVKNLSCISCEKNHEPYMVYYNIKDLIYCPVHLPNCTPIIMECEACKGNFIAKNIHDVNLNHYCDDCYKKTLKGYIVTQSHSMFKHCSKCTNPKQEPIFDVLGYVMCHSCTPKDANYFRRECNNCTRIFNRDTIGPVHVNCGLCEKIPSKTNVSVVGIRNVGKDSVVSNINVTGVSIKIETNNNINSESTDINIGSNTNTNMNIDTNISENISTNMKIEEDSVVQLTPETPQEEQVIDKKFIEKLPILEDDELYLSRYLYATKGVYSGNGKSVYNSFEIICPYCNKNKSEINMKYKDKFNIRNCKSCNKVFGFKWKKENPEPFFHYKSYEGESRCHICDDEKRIKRKKSKYVIHSIIKHEQQKGVYYTLMHTYNNKELYKNKVFSCKKHIVEGLKKRIELLKEDKKNYKIFVDDSGSCITIFIE